MSPGRPFTAKEAKLLQALGSGPRRYTDLLRAGGYGSKGLALALARLRAAGLVARDGRGKNSIYRLTDEGRKQALRWWMAGELEAFSEEATYDELRGTAERMYSLLLSERRAEKRVNGGHEPGAAQMSREDEELEEDDNDDEEEGWGDEEPEEDY
ncbi:MAG: hypothetical protein JRN17_01625 [Nitrososphaerota archaeon]|nr:hypothetical protein [Nitrososphaerota archaeon]